MRKINKHLPSSGRLTLAHSTASHNGTMQHSPSFLPSSFPSEPLDKPTFSTSANFGFLYQTGPFVFPESNQKSDSAFHKFVHMQSLLSWKILFLGHSYFNKSLNCIFMICLLFCMGLVFCY